MASHSSTFAWKIPWTEEPGGLQSMGLLELDMTERLHFSLSCIGEGNGNPLQCSCQENPRDGEAWLAAVSGVMQSRTRLRRLSSSSSSRELWRATIHGVAMSRTRLSDWTELNSTQPFAENKTKQNKKTWNFNFHDLHKFPVCRSLSTSHVQVWYFVISIQVSTSFKKISFPPS